MTPERRWELEQKSKIIFYVKLSAFWVILHNFFVVCRFIQDIFFQKIVFILSQAVNSMHIKCE